MIIKNFITSKLKGVRHTSYIYLFFNRIFSNNGLALLFSITPFVRAIRESQYLLIHFSIN